MLGFAGSIRRTLSQVDAVPREKDKVFRVTNAMSLMPLVIVLIILGLSLFFTATQTDLIIAIVSSVVLFAGYLSIRFWFMRTRSLASRMALIILSTLHIAWFNTVYDNDANSDYFFMLIIVLSFLIFGRHERKASIAATLFVVAVASTINLLFSVLQVPTLGEWIEPREQAIDIGDIGFGISNVILAGVCIAIALNYITLMMGRTEDSMQLAKEETERLLLNILPESIANRLLSGESPIADSHEQVTVLFADLVNFTEMASRTPPAQLVTLLDRIFIEFDKISRQHGLEKIKTIGDAYMAVSGLPRGQKDHASVACHAARDFVDAIERINVDLDAPLAIRIGLHSGPVVAGVIGQDKFIYDLWGDTVNLASRLESQGEPGQIAMSETTLDLAKLNAQDLTRREIDIKGKGLTPVFFWQGGSVLA